MRGVLRFAIVCLVGAAAVAALGLLVAALSSASIQDAVAWTLWIGGGMIVFLAAGSDSPAQRMSDTKVVVGGRFTDAPPLPRSPIELLVVGLLCIGGGTLVFLVG